MLKYRSLKIIADLWLAMCEALVAAAAAVDAAAHKVMEQGITLDEKATEAARDAHNKTVAEHANRLEATSNVVDTAEAQGKELIRKAEAAVVLLVSRARTVENDAIDAYGAAVAKSRAFLDKAIAHHQ